MKKIIIACGVLATFSLISCATIFTGTKDNIAFNSTPNNATVSINGIDKCTTPCTVSVKRSLGKTSVQVTKDNYEPKTFVLDKTFNLASILDVFSVVVGVGIDAATGSLLKYDTQSYNIELKPKK